MKNVTVVAHHGMLFTNSSHNAIVATVKKTIVLHSNSHCQADRAGHWFYTLYPAGVEEKKATPVKKTEDF